MHVVWLLLALWLAAPGVASAQRLPYTVTPTHYDLRFDVDIEHARFEGTSTIQIDVARDTRTVVLHAAELDITTAAVGRGQAMQNATLTFDADAETVTLTVPRALEQGVAELHLRWSGTLNDKLRGFYLSHGPRRNYAVTQFESTDARRAFPCFDEPAFKATFDISLTIDRDDVAISNGTVTTDTPVAGGRRHRITFSRTPKMSPYLVAMAVGDFRCLGDTVGTTPLRVCVRPDQVALTTFGLEAARQALRFYNDYFDIQYPFGKLDIVGVPDLAAGAMENTAAIFIRESELLTDDRSSAATRKEVASAIAHEIAHQWFGNLVTMAWWDDLWLNEGFATWIGNRPLAAWKPEWDIPIDEALDTQVALSVDSLSGTRPVRAAVATPAEIEETFDVIAYQKGAAILRMVENFVGRQVFRTGVNAYLAAHAYGTATASDFWNAMSQASGKPVDQIMSGFITQSGAPLVGVSAACDAGRMTVTLSQQRFSVAAGQLSPLRWTVPYCIKTSGAPARTCDILTEPTQVTTLPMCPAWLFVNGGASGYFRTAYDRALLGGIAPHVAGDLSAPERLSLIDDEWALVSTGRHGIDEYLTLASRFNRDLASGVLGQVVERLSFVHDALLTPSTRPRFEAFIRSLFAPVAEELGREPPSTDDEPRRRRRELVMRTLGTIGNDAATIAAARAAVDAALKSGATLDPSTGSALVRIAAAHGDAPLFEAFVAAADRATTPEDRYLYLNAAGAFEDRAVVARGLARALTSGVRAQDAPGYLSSFLANRAARAQAWSFVKDHWSDVERKVSVFDGDVQLVRALGSLCDRESRTDVAAFFEAHPLPSATRTLGQTLERIDSCVRMRETQMPALDGWLAAR